MCEHCNDDNFFRIPQVVAWCAVPIPFDDAVLPPPNNNDTNVTISQLFPYNMANLYNESLSWGLHTSEVTISPKDFDNTPSVFRIPVEINFWFFLFFYFGVYNAIALLLITKIFSIYALNWWPKALGGI